MIWRQFAAFLLIPALVLEPVLAASADSELQTQALSVISAWVGRRNIDPRQTTEVHHTLAKSILPPSVSLPWESDLERVSTLEGEARRNEAQNLMQRMLLDLLEEHYGRLTPNSVNDQMHHMIQIWILELLRTHVLDVDLSDPNVMHEAQKILKTWNLLRPQFSKLADLAQDAQSLFDMLPDGESWVVAAATLFNRDTPKFHSRVKNLALLGIPYVEKFLALQGVHRRAAFTVLDPGDALENDEAEDLPTYLELLPPMLRHLDSELDAVERDGLEANPERASALRNSLEMIINGFVFPMSQGPKAYQAFIDHARVLQLSDGSYKDFISYLARGQRLFPDLFPQQIPTAYYYFWDGIFDVDLTLMAARAYPTEGFPSLAAILTPDPRADSYRQMPPTENEIFHGHGVHWTQAAATRKHTEESYDYLRGLVMSAAVISPATTSSRPWEDEIAKLSLFEGEAQRLEARNLLDRMLRELEPKYFAGKQIRIPVGLDLRKQIKSGITLFMRDYVLDKDLSHPETLREAKDVLSIWDHVFPQLARVARLGGDTRSLFDMLPDTESWVIAAASEFVPDKDLFYRRVENLVRLGPRYSSLFFALQGVHRRALFSRFEVDSLRRDEREDLPTYPILVRGLLPSLHAGLRELERDGLAAHPQQTQNVFEILERLMNGYAIALSGELPSYQNLIDHTRYVRQSDGSTLDLIQLFARGQKLFPSLFPSKIPEAYRYFWSPIILQEISLVSAREYPADEIPSLSLILSRGSRADAYRSTQPSMTEQLNGQQFHWTHAPITSYHIDQNYGYLRSLVLKAAEDLPPPPAPLSSEERALFGAA